MSLLFIISVLAAMWVYRDAKKFGHSKNSAMLWGVGTIAFFVIFFPLYLLLGRKFQMKPKKWIEPQTIDAEAVFADKDAKDCPMCARKVQADFKICPYCGHTLKPTCENCGVELDRAWDHCHSCQAKTPEK